MNDMDNDTQLPIKPAQYPLYRVLAMLVQARDNCDLNDNREWRFKHEYRILELVKEHMPSGSGIDCGTTIDFVASTPEKLVFNASYHHMDQNGSYDGWTDHIITVRPSLQSGIKISISGSNRNDIKDYLYDCFHTALTETKTTL